MRRSSGQGVCLGAQALLSLCHPVFHKPAARFSLSCCVISVTEGFLRFFTHLLLLFVFLHNSFGELISISMLQGLEDIIMQESPAWQILKYIEFSIPKWLVLNNNNKSQKNKQEYILLYRVSYMGVGIWEVFVQPSLETSSVGRAISPHNFFCMLIKKHFAAVRTIIYLNSFCCNLKLFSFTTINGLGNSLFLLSLKVIILLCFAGGVWLF